MLPEGNGWLLADTRDEAEGKARRLMDRLKNSPGAPDMKLVTELEPVQRIWDVREAALGAETQSQLRPGSRESARSRND